VIVLAVDRACPACGALLDQARHTVMTKDSFDLVRCPTCGLLSRAVLPDREELAEIYSADYFTNDRETAADGYANYLRDERLHRMTARRRLGLLERLVPMGSRRLLDVGSAAGFFVDEAMKRGWTARGVDISAEMVDWGRRELGVPLELGTLDGVTAESFSAVTMWDYIEHSVDPVGEIERCREILVPGGVIALSTGDSSSVFAKVSGKRWHLLTPRHHNFFFDVSTLRRMLQRVGFTDVSAKHFGARYSLAHLAYKLERMLRIPGGEAFARGLDRSRIGALGIPVNLFDIVTVTARKPGRS
jgi:2-polyprenyl-3-methyl-5-hydroxy-6-metoxy-1,4-benzoquinol methylase